MSFSLDSEYAESQPHAHGFRLSMLGSPGRELISDHPVFNMAWYFM